MADRWYVARVRPGPLELPSRSTARQRGLWEYPLIRLRQQGYECFTPIIKIMRLVHGRIEWIERLLFSQYIFVKFDVETRHWQSINGTSGVQYLLPVHSEQPLALPDGFVEQLMAMKNVQHLEALTEGFARDRLVKMIAGPLRSHIGRVVSSSARKTRIRLAMLDGRELVVEARTNTLVPVAEA